MKTKIKKVWVVEECLFPLDKNPNWDKCCEFETEEEAQNFAWGHYANKTNYDNGPETCDCEDCADGWKVDQTWWKSYSVRVRNTQTGKES
jgi:hypothetical protein